ncbi:MAG: glucokinase [Deltaproteobacteria bacterium RBG_13_65_10]|nr:MAG: glucokinase [Deltaproteobacteria bacterium RBG_13_65_10]
MILAGDVGGTHTVLALFDESGESLRPAREATYASRDHGSFEELLEKFLRQDPRPTVRAACFGVAGPVVEGRARMTNLPWRLDEMDLARAIGTSQVKLLNDLQAAALGMLHLRRDELVDLNPEARERKGNIAVIASGTGLGEALLYWDGERHHPVASEGGHVEFAPRTDQEIALLVHLQQALGGRVSYERVVSGRGLHNIYQFLRDTGRAPEDAGLARKIASGDPAAAIGEEGISGRDPLSVAALDLFVSIYGAEAGNLALKGMALGGVFVGGGIAPKILPALRTGAFLRSFVDKGRYTDLMRGIPVRVALNPGAPLLGAAHHALGL